MAARKKGYATDRRRLNGEALTASETSVAAYAGRLAQIELPRELAFILAAIGVFLLAAIGISEATGAPFVFPTEKASPATGTHFMLPIVITAAVYLVVHAMVRLLQRGRAPIGTFIGNAAYDLFMLALFVFVMTVHFHLKMWMPIVHPHLYDAAYMQVDEDFRVIVELFTTLRNAVARLLPGTDDLYEGAFFGAFVLSFVAQSLGERRWLHHNLAAILLVEMIGPLTYLIAPAVGPFVYERGPNSVATKVQLAMYEAFQRVESGGPAWVAAHGGDYITQPLAAMPSLHVAATLVMAYYAHRARLRSAPAFYLVLG